MIMVGKAKELVPIGDAVSPCAQRWIAGKRLDRFHFVLQQAVFLYARCDNRTTQLAQRIGLMKVKSDITAIYSKKGIVDHTHLPSFRKLISGTYFVRSLDRRCGCSVSG